jgi:DMSO/TMAO reductase YedYZ heme-binding membrane subunit
VVQHRRERRDAGQHAARRALGAAAFAYAQTHFTPETCFAEIADWLARGAPAAAARLNPAVAAGR